MATPPDLQESRHFEWKMAECWVSNFLGVTQNATPPRNFDQMSSRSVYII